jgi:hypothetical protein
MKKQAAYSRLTFAGILLGFLFLTQIAAQEEKESIEKHTRLLMLGATKVKVNVYEKKGSPITFFAPHYNERTGADIAKELIGKKGGRLVEIESVDASGNASRQLSFTLAGKSYAIDPNRIYTENGRACSNVPEEINRTVVNFSEGLLKIVFPENGNKLRAGEKFLVAVHNNGDIDDPNKSASARENDLTAYAFVKYGKGTQFLRGRFQEQSDGAYLSTVEADEDNFFFLSSPAFLSFFAERGFNAIVQKSAAKLHSKNCAVDDGSLSVFSGQQNIPYINVEADAAHGGARQRQMLEAVYELLRKTIQLDSKAPAIEGRDAGKRR